MVDNTRLESAIERLTEISGELKSIIAVHEQRITQQEKNTDIIYDILDQRRKETDHRVDDIYNTMRNQDNRILEEIAKLRAETQEQFKDMNSAMNKLEKYIWMAIGATGIVSWLVAYGVPNLLHYIK